MVLTAALRRKETMIVEPGQWNDKYYLVLRVRQSDADIWSSMRLRIKRSRNVGILFKFEIRQ